MSTSFINPFSSGNQSGNMDLYDDEEDFDNVLGIGTSKLNGTNGIRPNTIMDLISIKPIKFVVGVLQNKEEEIPYRAINARPQPIIITTPLDTTSRPISSPATSTSILKSVPIPTTLSSTSTSNRPKGFFPPIDPAVTWPKQMSIGRGLNNLGNTCFLNSALQVLLHTAPLVRYTLANSHDMKECAWCRKKGYCMTCAMGALVRASYNPASHSAYSPTYVTNNIRKIATHLRLGRQEDAHEFLRFCIDNMQLGCLVDKPAKLDQAIKDSTFVHQIFGGRLRSRVTCRVCSHPSDTFDSILDLSLDVNKVGSVREALNTFIKVDELKGANKYKCEKCKKLVIAEKSFTIEEAPMVLSIHLKRFTAAGRKISDVISYQETLDLGPYMSNKNQRPLYRLYGVINHSGGGPHSGHYTAHVKSAAGQWHHMNDSSVSTENRPPLNSRNAYILFYCREQGNRLEAAINGGTSAANMANKNMNGNGKRSRESIEGSVGVERMNGNGNGAPSAKKAFIGPTNPNDNSPRPPIVAASNSPTRPPYHNPYSTNINSNNNQNGGGGIKSNGFKSNVNNNSANKIYNNLKKKNNAPRILSAHS